MLTHFVVFLLLERDLLAFGLRWRLLFSFDKLLSNVVDRLTPTRLVGFVSVRFMFAKLVDAVLAAFAGLGSIGFIPHILSNIALRSEQSPQPRAQGFFTVTCSLSSTITSVIQVRIGRSLSSKSDWCIWSITCIWSACSSPKSMRPHRWQEYVKYPLFPRARREKILIFFPLANCFVWARNFSSKSLSIYKKGKKEIGLKI